MACQIFDCLHPGSVNMSKVRCLSGACCAWLPALLVSTQPNGLAGGGVALAASGLPALSMQRSTDTVQQLPQVDFNYRNEVDFLKNYKELQKAFDSVSCPKARCACALLLGAAGCWPAYCAGGAGSCCCHSECHAHLGSHPHVGLFCQVLSRAQSAAHLPAVQEFNPAALSKGKLQDNNEFMQVRLGWQEHAAVRMQLLGLPIQAAQLYAGSKGCQAQQVQCALLQGR